MSISSSKNKFLLIILAASFLWLPHRFASAEQKSLYQQAMEEVDAGDMEKALQLFNKLEKTDRKRALIGKLDLYKRMGDNEKVIETVDELKPLVPGSVRLRLEKAIALRNLGGWEKAESELKGIEDQIEADPKLIVEYGRYLLFKGDVEAAQKVFERALELDPNSDKAKIGLAYCHVWREEDAEAQALVNAVRAKNPDSLDALILQGWILAWHSRYREAVKVFEKANSLRPNHPEVIRGLAQTYSWDGQYDRSIEYYKVDLGMQPDNPDIMLSLAQVYEKEGKYSEAIGILSQAVSASPEREDLQQELNLAKKWTSEVDQKIKDLKKRIDLNRGNIQDFLSLGQAYRWRGQVSQSRKIYKAALEKDPDNTTLLYGYAQVLEESNDLEGARKNYKRILELKPNFMDAALALQRIGLAFRPALMVQYNFVRSNLDSARSIIQEHVATIEYSQRLHSLYTLRTGYTFDPIHDANKDTHTTNLALFHHQFYLQNELTLPYAITGILRYDFHDYTNHGDNDFNLSGQKINHGGYVLFSKPVPYNLFAFEFSRQFFQFIDPNGEIAIGRTHSLTFSDDLSFGAYVSSQLSFATTNDTQTQVWGRTYKVHPRLVLPFFTPATIEYEGGFTQNPTGQQHSGIVKLVGQLGGKLQFEGRYALSYFTLTHDLGHDVQAFLTWAPIDRISVTLTGDVDIHGGDLIQNYLLSFTTFL